MSKSITECIIDFTNDLDVNGYKLSEMTMELPYGTRLQIQHEMIQKMRGYESDRYRGRIPEFTLNTRGCPVLITSLKSEREQALRSRLTDLEKQRIVLDKQEKELQEMLKGITNDN